MTPTKIDSSPCQVKICGVRETSQAQALDNLKVDWIGFNFFPKSARYIAPEAAAPMIRDLRHAKSVGVFVEAELNLVLDIINKTGVQYVQLHGHESWDYISKMPVPVIKAIPHTQLSDLGGLRTFLEKQLSTKLTSSPLAYFLIDTQIKADSASAFGGSGEVFDWNLLKENNIPLPYFLAGGLGPKNLAKALEACSPFAVDLNSRVEVSPGYKDLDAVKECLRLVRRV